MDDHVEVAALRRLAAGVLMPGFAGAVVPEWVREAYRGGLRSVCVHGTNIVDTPQFSRLCAELRALGEITVSLDEEGGDVTRLHYLEGSPEPGNGVLGRLDDGEATRDSARRIGEELAAYGVTLALGPVADVNSSDDNPVIGARSFGTDPELVGRHTAHWIEGMQSTGVAACAKHFPGHGDTSVNSHHSQPVVGAAAELLLARELVPFASAVAAGVASVMTSHIVIPALDPQQPATFSRRILVDLLRGRLGYQGVVISDALDMQGASGGIGVPEAAVRALLAGCDLLCTGADTTETEYASVVDALVAAVFSGRLPVARLEEAWTRATSLARPPALLSLAPSSGPSLEASRVQLTFDVSAAAAAWLDDPAPVALLQVASLANPAVGMVPWGPASVRPDVPVIGAGAVVDTAALVGAEVPVAGAKVAVVGRDIGSTHPALAVAAALREQGHHVIVVNCGWPRGASDLATRGGSSAVSEALVNLLLRSHSTLHASSHS